MFRRKKPQPLPEKQYPLVLKTKWRTDLLDPREGRFNALKGLTGPSTPRPLTMAQKARVRRCALTFADIQRVEDFGLHRVPPYVANEVARLRALRDTRAVAAE
jgi:hypothetical protein